MKCVIPRLFIFTNNIKKNLPISYDWCVLSVTQTHLFKREFCVRFNLIQSAKKNVFLSLREWLSVSFSNKTELCSLFRQKIPEQWLADSFSDFRLIEPKLKITKLEIVINAIRVCVCLSVSVCVCVLFCYCVTTNSIYHRYTIPSIFLYIPIYSIECYALLAKLPPKISESPVWVCLLTCLIESNYKQSKILTVLCSPRHFFLHTNTVQHTQSTSSSEHQDSFVNQSAFVCGTISF